MRLAIAGPTGGAGRTTMVLNLGLTLSNRGLRVVMIDLDPQGGLAFHIARKDDEWAGLADLLMGRVTLDQAVKRSNRPLLALLPRGRLGPGDTCEFEQSLRKPDVLRAALRNLERSFDVILMDLPSGVGMIPRGAMAVASDLVLAVAAETPSVRAVTRMLSVIDQVRETENPALGLLTVLPTMVGQESVRALDLLNRMGVPMHAEGIPRSARFRSAAERGQPLVPGRSSEDASPEMVAIHDLADLVEARIRESDPSRPNGTVTPSDAPSRFLNFQSHRFRPKQPAAVDRDVPGRAGLDSDRMPAPRGLQEWKVYLRSCLGATRSETAFVMDSQGLTLASQGRLHGGQIENLGARLMIAYEQVGVMDIAGGSVRSVIVEFDHLWLTGLRAEAVAGQTFTIGLLGGEPVGPTAREQIREGLKAHQGAVEYLEVPIEL